MADSKISALTEKTTFGETDFLAGTQGTDAGDNRKYGKAAIKNAAEAMPLSGTAEGSPVTGNIELSKSTIAEGEIRIGYVDGADESFIRFTEDTEIQMWRSLAGNTSSLTVTPEQITLTSNSATFILDENVAGLSGVDLSFNQNRGVVLRSPNNTQYRITVENDGTLTTTAL